MMQDYTGPYNTIYIVQDHTGPRISLQDKLGPYKQIKQILNKFDIFQNIQQYIGIL